VDKKCAPTTTIVGAIGFCSVGAKRMADFSTRHKQSVEYASQIRRLPVSHSIRPLGPTHSAFGFERFTPSVAVAIWRASR
jgi:hypothetical protein